MKYASVCDGIGAAHAAWLPLGWECAWHSEIDPFPAAVVEHRFGARAGPNLGDMTAITDEEMRKHGAIDLLVGGTPCQSFSLAGLRGGMDDPRGGLARVFLQLARRSGARWVVWENVPGVLSSNGGRDFGSILGGLVELGYGFAYRVLDARYFGVPQRRRRVFVVGHLGDWRRATAVLFERESLRGDFESGKEEGASVAGAIRERTSISRGAQDAASGHLFVVHATMDPISSQHTAPAFGRGSKNGCASLAVSVGTKVRRITPRECERLQGFEADFTLIPYRGKPAADGPRYRALGNSMAVPVMRWIGERIAKVDSLELGRAGA